MSSQGNGSPIRFRVSISKQNQERLKELLREALQVGKGHAFLTAFRYMIQRLRRDPLEFGEFVFRLPALQLKVFQVVVIPLALDYAVHEEWRVVFIKGVKTLW